MYLVIRGDRLYEGYSIVYTTKSGKKSTKGCIGKALGSKSELLAKGSFGSRKTPRWTKEKIRTQSSYRENKAAFRGNSEEASVSSVCRRAGALLRKLHPQAHLEWNPQAQSIGSVSAIQDRYWIWCRGTALADGCQQNRLPELSSETLPLSNELAWKFLGRD